MYIGKIYLLKREIGKVVYNYSFSIYDRRRWKGYEKEETGWERNIYSRRYIKSNQIYINENKDTDQE